MTNEPSKNCRLCPRLVAHRRSTKKLYPDYHNSPVPAWGDRRGRVMVVGLAPGLHGAHKTGKAFVGDASGQLLFAALVANGFSTHEDPSQARLIGLTITNAVKCLPPNNAPTASEVNTCRKFLESELDQFAPERMRHPRCIVALGGVAYRALQGALGERLQPFRHGQETLTSKGVVVLASFHPSRLNVNTGRINLQMLIDIFRRAQELKLAR